MQSQEPTTNLLCIRQRRYTPIQIKAEGFPHWGPSIQRLAAAYSPAEATMNIVHNASLTHNFFAARMNWSSLEWSRNQKSNPEPIHYKWIALPIELLRHSKNHHIYASDWDQLQPCYVFFMTIFTLLASRDFPQLFSSWVLVLSHLSASCRQGSLSFRCAPLLAVVETLSTLGLTPYLHRCDVEKYKTRICLSNALPIELQTKFLCCPPERIWTSNRLIPIA